jgi:hypothetical protein
MDEQCTVARPGLAPMAGALAVELMAAVLQHPAGVAAPSPEQQKRLPPVDLPLGPPPHMVRHCHPLREPHFPKSHWHRINRAALKIALCCIALEKLGFDVTR